jgi:PKD repeat protein
MKNELKTHINTLILITIVVSLSYIIVSPVSGTPADSGVLKIPSDVVEKVNQLELPDTWENAKAGQPVLQHILSESGEKIIPNYWVVPIEKEGCTIGIIGIDPYTGEYSWRLNDLPNMYKFPSPPLENVVKGKIMASSLNPNNYSIEDEKIKFVLIDLQNYWIIPKIKGEVTDNLLIPAENPNELISIKNVKEIKSIKKEDITNENIDQHRLGKSKFDSFIKNRKGGIEKSSASLTDYTWMVNKVPIYDQGGSSWCGPYSLSMIHQWWSPVNLGSGYSQASEIADYNNQGWNEGMTTSEAVNVLRHWHDIDSSYESWPLSGWVAMNDIQKGNPTWQNSDLKTWIYNCIPVLVSVDANAEGAWWYNHWSVVVGYNDYDFNNNGGVYVNNPWGFLGFPGHQPAVEYSTFNDDVWVFNPNVLHDNVGIIGFPGDGIYTSGDYVDTSISLQNVPSSMYDDEEITITIKTDILDDGTASSPSSFGEWVKSGFHIRTTGSDGLTGDGLIKVNSLGDFDEWYGYKGRSGETLCSSTTSSSGEAKIFEFYTDSNSKGDTLDVSVRIDPTDIGDLTIGYRSWVFDEDDRIHDSDLDLTIDVYNLGSLQEMHKPVIYLKGDPSVWMYGRNYLDYGTHSTTITVHDDDTTGPGYSNLNSIPSSPVYDSHSGSIRLQGDVSDPSGIYSVSFGYGYHGVIDYWKSPAGHSGSTYWYDIPRNEWINHLGDMICWRIHASDNDNDRPNDREDSWSGWQYVEIKDNTAPPAPTISSSTHPNENNWYNNNDPSFTWTTPSDTSGIAGYSYTLDHSSSTTPDTSVDTTGNSASYSNKADGTWYFHVRAKDNAGNWGSADHYRVKIDTANPPAPAISSSTHPNENNWYANNDPSFTWTTPSDPSGIAGYSYTLDHSSSTTPDTSVDTIGNSKSYSNKADGTWYFHVQAKDSAGNWGSADHYRVKIDTGNPSVPTISSSTHPNENNWYNNNNPSFTWTIPSDTSGIAGYSYTLDHSSSTTPDTSVDTTGNSKSYSNIADGTWYFHVRAKDNAGNWGSADHYRINIDTNNPPYTPSNPSPSNHATGQSINADLSWTGGDPDAGDTVTYDVYFGTTTSPPLVSNDQSGTTYDPGTLSYNTKYYWKIIATDNHGASTTGLLWDFTTGSAVTATIFINPPYKEVKPSETFYLNVSVNSTALIGAGSVQIEFNADAFSANDVTPGGLWTGTPSVAEKTIDNIAGIIKYDLYTMPGTPLKSRGNFAVINITAKETAAEMDYPIDITDAILSDGDYVEIPEVVAEGGVVSVKERLQGDVDGDCDVDFHDLLAVLRAYGLHCGEPSYNPNADFDHDCDVDFHDLLTLLRHYGETCEKASLATTAPTLARIPAATAEMETASVYIAPTEIEVNISETFSLNVSVDSDVTLSAGGINLSFNSSVLTAEDIVPGNLWTGTPSVAEKKIDNITGIIKYDLFTMPGTALKSSGSFAVITFMVKKDAPSGEYQIELQEVVMANSTYYEIIVDTTNGSVIIRERVPPNITSFSPTSPVSDYKDATRTFNITVDQIVNVSWQINRTEVQTNGSVTEASYMNVSAEIGTWNVSAIVANQNGTDMQTWIWNVTEPPNQPPIANFTYSPGNLLVNQSVTFNASSSYDPDGFITNYEWNFGDGTNETGEIVTHSYSSTGNYTVNLTVTDNDGATNSTSKIVDICPTPNKPPIAKFIYSPPKPFVKLFVNQTITFDASSSYDPDGNITSYEWDFGDGNTTNTTEEIVTHLYSSTGNYTVNLTVTDDDGANNSASEIIEVREAKPTVSIFTNKKEYHTWDIMMITIGLVNPTESTQQVLFKWDLILPDYDYWINITSTEITLSPMSVEYFLMPLHIVNWPPTEFNATWYVAFSNTTTLKLISEDTAPWKYGPRKMAKGERKPEAEEIATEITKSMDKLYI